MGETDLGVFATLRDLLRRCVIDRQPDLGMIVENKLKGKNVAGFTEMQILEYVEQIYESAKRNLDATELAEDFHYIAVAAVFGKWSEVFPVDSDIRRTIRSIAVSKLQEHFNDPSGFEAAADKLMQYYRDPAYKGLVKLEIAEGMLALNFSVSAEGRVDLNEIVAALRSEQERRNLR